VLNVVLKPCWAWTENLEPLAWWGLRHKTPGYTHWKSWTSTTLSWHRRKPRTHHLIMAKSQNPQGTHIENHWTSTRSWTEESLEPKSPDQVKGTKHRGTHIENHSTSTLSWHRRRPRTQITWSGQRQRTPGDTHWKSLNLNTLLTQKKA
jgi:hypothetical protein